MAYTADSAAQPTLFGRALVNLRGAWRDISDAAGLTRADGTDLTPARLEQLRQQIDECVVGVGGEVSARARAADIGQFYLGLKAEAREQFLDVLAREFGSPRDKIEAAIDLYHESADEDARIKAMETLSEALVAPRVALLTQFNTLPEGVKFLVDMRADLLSFGLDTPERRALDADFRRLLISWFDIGFLDMKSITWDSPATLLEKLIEYEAVHEIQSWNDLRNRLAPDRRCFAFFHPRMPSEPLIFVEVALVKGISGSVQALLDEHAPDTDTGEADTAIFYSISNTQAGLKGISFGNFLIKRVVDALAAEIPNLKQYSTLSPIPGLRRWLARQWEEKAEDLIPADDREKLRTACDNSSLPFDLPAVLDEADWVEHEELAEALERPLTRLAARYLVEKRSDGRPIDPVARFHLGNGARVERVNWKGDISKKGFAQAAGLMVNYLYKREDIETNHEAFHSDGTIPVSAAIADLAQAAAPKTGKLDVAIRGPRSALRRVIEGV
ncbi:MAG: malonyl-CoA decarboxylase [Alphaproteobacteria bacterium]|nr:malonyl-CoA decarboxylase [Alphaproteobacteria bacterium]